MVSEHEEPDQVAPVGLTVAQMAKATGVSGHTLRYYERAGLIHPITRTSGNQRRYQPADIEWMRLLVRLRESGMPIAQLPVYAALRAGGDATLSEQLGLLTEHRKTVRRQIRRLRDHERALNAWIENHQ